MNHYAAFLSRTKTAARDVDVGSLLTELAHFRSYMDHCRRGSSPPPGASPPPGFRSRVPFLRPAVVRQVLDALDFMVSMKEGW